MTANRTERNALANVIDAWERNETAPLFFVEPRACDLHLCARHYGVRFGDEPCEGCPIFKVTNVSTCTSSPWGRAYGSYLTWKRDPDSHVGEAAQSNFRREAKEYVAWLKRVKLAYEAGDANALREAA